MSRFGVMSRSASAAITAGHDDRSTCGGDAGLIGAQRLSRPLEGFDDYPEHTGHGVRQNCI
jgi:hypothetical protein